MNEKQFLTKLSRFITEDRGGVRAYARELGVSPSYISAVKTGKKPPSQRILDDIGYERVEKITFKKLVEA